MRWGPFYWQFLHNSYWKVILFYRNFITGQYNFAMGHVGKIVATTVLELG